MDIAICFVNRPRMLKNGYIITLDRIPELLMYIWCLSYSGIVYPHTEIISSLPYSYFISAFIFGLLLTKMQLTSHFNSISTDTTKQTKHIHPLFYKLFGRTIYNIFSLYSVILLYPPLYYIPHI